MKIEHRKQLYSLAEKAITGSKIKCPGCGDLVTKTTYQKKFCNSICKDKYWNTVKPNPPSHYRKYNNGDKSYKSFKERVNHGSHEAPGWPLGVDEGNEGWDGHK